MKTKILTLLTATAIAISCNMYAQSTDPADAANEAAAAAEDAQNAKVDAEKMEAVGQQAAITAAIQMAKEGSPIAEAWVAGAAQAAQAAYNTAIAADGQRFAMQDAVEAAKAYYASKLN